MHLYRGIASDIMRFMHYLMFYDLSSDYLERRIEFRAQHLALAWQASERGEMILGGALADPVDGAVLLFQGDSPAVAGRFAAADPYVRNGLVTRWRVRPWTTVVGETAAAPVRTTV
jgi:uncharacterized protein YciI